jgi:hypothetical protein
MGKGLGIGWKIGLLAILALMVGLGTWRQYVKYVDGRGFYTLVLGTEASSSAQILVFVVLPAIFVLAAFIYALRDLR